MHVRSWVWRGLCIRAQHCSRAVWLWLCARFGLPKEVTIWTCTQCTCYMICHKTWTSLDAEARDHAHAFCSWCSQRCDECSITLLCLQAHPNMVTFIAVIRQFIAWISWNSSIIWYLYQCSAFSAIVRCYFVCLDHNFSQIAGSSSHCSSETYQWGYAVYAPSRIKN